MPNAKITIVENARQSSIRPGKESIAVPVALLVSHKCTARLTPASLQHVKLVLMPIAFQITVGDAQPTSTTKRENRSIA